MGVDIHMYFQYRKSEGEFEELALYVPNKDGFKRIPVIGGRPKEMMDILDGDGDYVPAFSAIDVKKMAPSIYARYIKAFPEDKKFTGCYDPHMLNAAMLQNYLLEHPTVIDYDANWTDEMINGEALKPTKQNPLFYLFQQLNFYMEAYGLNWDNDSVYSDIYLVYWFDC